MSPNLKSETSNRARRGISLLEVLFAIFVAAVGLLGLAALLTVGGVQTAQSEQADRSAAFGRYSMREIETRNMLRPFVGPFRSYDPNNPPNPPPTNTPNWVDANGNAWPNANGSPPDVQYTVTTAQFDFTHYQRLPAFVIDPLFIAANGPGSPPKFPLFQDSSIPPSDPQKQLQLPRVTLAGLYFPAPWNASNQALSRDTTDRVFTCRDDVEFFPPDKLSRPDMLVDVNKQVATIAGNYSYLVMVTPSEAENPVPTAPADWTPQPDPNNRTPYYKPLNKAVALDDRRLYTVQVVVFYKRVTAVSTPPSPPYAERQVKLDPASTTAQSVSLLPTDASLVAGLAPNQWIMLSGYLKPPNDEPNLVRPIHRWVRIVSIGEVQKTDPGPPPVLLKRLNFAGPDWGAGLDANNPIMVATIVDNVVGVYERTIELDARSITDFK